jgi:hypothetical protein
MTGQVHLARALFGVLLVTLTACSSPASSGCTDRCNKAVDTSGAGGAALSSLGQCIELCIACIEGDQMEGQTCVTPQDEPVNAGVGGGAGGAGGS